MKYVGLSEIVRIRVHPVFCLLDSRDEEIRWVSRRQKRPHTPVPLQFPKAVQNCKVIDQKPRTLVSSLPFRHIDDGPYALRVRSSLICQPHILYAPALVLSSSSPFSVSLSPRQHVSPAPPPSASSSSASHDLYLRPSSVRALRPPH